MSAIDEKTDYAYTKSRVTDDGHGVRAIGHVRDFIYFGLA